MIITMNSGKAGDKIQHQFMTKTNLSKLEIVGNFLNLITIPMLTELFFFFCFLLFRAVPAAYGSSQARGRI